MFWSIYNKILSLFGFDTDTNNEKADDEESFMIREVLLQEIKESENVEESFSENCNDIVDTSDCFERTGVVTYLADGEGYGLIDGDIYFDYDPTIFYVRLKDKVRYLCTRIPGQDTVKFVKIIQQLGCMWDEENVFVDEKKFKSLTHILVEQVISRDGRLVKGKNDNLVFDLDKVESSFIPVEGDWLELQCTVKWDDENVTVITADQVLEVLSIRPLRKSIKCCKITQLSDNWGTCDKDIYFDTHTFMSNGFVPHLGASVIVESIESNQTVHNWRAIKIIADDKPPVQNADLALTQLDSQEQDSLEIEKMKKIKLAHPISFEDVDFESVSAIEIDIFNESDTVYRLIKWKLMNSKVNSQLSMNPYIERRINLYPNQKFTFKLTCKPKVLGQSKELLVFVFEGFELKRWVNISVLSNHIVKSQNKVNGMSSLSKIDQMIAMHDLRKKKVNAVPGQPVKRTPNFVHVKLGLFAIPDKIWDAVLGDSSQTIYSKDFPKIMSRIEYMLPCVKDSFKLSNYSEKWHTLLYIEEVQLNVLVRNYDMPNAFLRPMQEFLALEIPGLSEKRPSIVTGDKVVVKEVWNKDSPSYEGYIHFVRGNTILIKFSHQFHEMYSGYDVSVQFHFSRSTFRRCHQATKLAISNLGPEILFPSRIKVGDPQLSPEKMRTLGWFNVNLNDGQKTAVENILKGVCRPLPYCIFGPPGTGKTITVVETILQILREFPESRVLVATPSNSASNLLTERLLDYKQSIHFSLIRIVANHLLESDNLPDILKPYCATLDIGIENTGRNHYKKRDDGVNLNCQSSFIGRHRVIIGTCSALGTLAQLSLHKGHFTHIIVDEAGQATEPEILIPLTFVDKQNGSIILAGDPQQLGPVVISRYAQELGLDESFLSRLLERYPYQKDFKTYASGYDNRLITRLTDNYRSIAQVLKVPSKLFYDSCLVAKFDAEASWVKELQSNIERILPNNKVDGGIFVYGVKGSNHRADDSPSWYNPQEAVMVLMFACKLYKRGVLPDQIGIITPYIAQIKYLRQLFEATGTPLTKIGTVEEFQGQERPIILLSAVRSVETFVDCDVKFALGFVRSPKRLNVALTRAMIACVVFCNPHLLGQDACWREVLRFAVDSNTYSGCDLPLSLTNASVSQDTE